MTHLLADYPALLSNTFLSQLLEDASDTPVFADGYADGPFHYYSAATPYPISGTIAGHPESNDADSTPMPEDAAPTPLCPDLTSPEDSSMFMTANTASDTQLQQDSRPSRNSVGWEDETFTPGDQSEGSPPAKKRQLPSRCKTNLPSGQRKPEKTPQYLPHKQVERNYRERQNKVLEQLRQAVPSVAMFGDPDDREGPRISKRRILSAAIMHIKQIEHERDELLKEKRRLQRLSL